MAFTRDNSFNDSFWGQRSIVYTATLATAEASPGDAWGPFPRYITIQVKGTAGAGLNIDLQVTNDDPTTGSPTWVNAPTPIGIGAVGPFKVSANSLGFRGYRFNKTAGHASTNVTITVCTTQT
jgi:hypothetical protein